MKFFTEPPIFAVEVRSEEDYGPSAEEKIEAKRADCFALDSANPVAVFGRGQTADAQSAVPSWTLNVSELFES